MMGGVIRASAKWLSIANENLKQVREQLEITNQESYHNSITDALTCLPNRRRLDDFLTTTLQLAQIEGTFPLPANLVRQDIDFMLKVQGESMIGAGILDGDLIIVRQQKEPRNGEIVVALIGDEATVKRFYKEKTLIRFQPENPTMEPIYSQDVTVLGKIVGVFRIMR